MGTSRRAAGIVGALLIAAGTVAPVLAASHREAPLIAADAADIRVGNSMKLRNIPVGTQIHAIELQPGRGAARTAPDGTAHSSDCASRDARYSGCRNGNLDAPW